MAGRGREPERGVHDVRHRPDASIFYHVTGAGRAIVSCAQCQVVTTAGCGSIRSRTCRATSRDHHGPARHGRSDRPPAATTGHPLRRPSRRASAEGSAGGPPSPSWRSRARAARLPVRGRHPRPALAPDPALRPVRGIGAAAVRGARRPGDSGTTSTSGGLRLFKRIFPEPHSLKGIEDCVGLAARPPRGLDRVPARHRRRQSVRSARPVRRPHSGLHGTEDRSCPYRTRRKMVAAIPGPVWSPSSGAATGCSAATRLKVHRFIRDSRSGGRSRRPGSRPPPSGRFPRRHAAGGPTRRAGSQRRVLWLSSPIGLGHVQPTFAIARRLRRRIPTSSSTSGRRSRPTASVQHWGGAPATRRRVSCRTKTKQLRRMGPPITSSTVQRSLGHGARSPPGIDDDVGIRLPHAGRSLRSRWKRARSPDRAREPEHRAAGSPRGASDRPGRRVDAGTRPLGGGPGSWSSTSQPEREVADEPV